MYDYECRLQIKIVGRRSFCCDDCGEEHEERSDPECGEPYLGYAPEDRDIERYNRDEHVDVE